jgi:hypothetical protein
MEMFVKAMRDFSSDVRKNSPMMNSWGQTPNGEDVAGPPVHHSRFEPWPLK